MMQYLIDGYNLLHEIGLLRGRAGPTGLEKARLALLGHLSGCYGEEASDVTVVFDATRAPPGVSDQTEYKGIHIHFTRHEEADDLIETLIRHSSAPQKLTVVSNDRRIRDAARRRKCPVLECLDYWMSLRHRRKPRTPQGESVGAKPEYLSEAEMQHWLEEFRDLAADADMKELFDPFDFGEVEAG